MLNQNTFAEVFCVGDIVKSGAGQRKDAAHLRIVSIEEEQVRYQSLRKQGENKFRYSYLQMLIDNFSDLDSKQIQKSVNKVLKKAGFQPNYSTENYAYTLVKAYQDRTSFFLSQGELASPQSAQFRTSDFSEGERSPVLVERIERDGRARQACIDHYGAICHACHFNFEKVYGLLGSGFIHVHHHRIQLATTEGKHSVDPISDLIPLCPNCHAMVHRSRNMLAVEEIVRMMEANREDHEIRN